MARHHFSVAVSEVTMALTDLHRIIMNTINKIDFLDIHF